VRIGVISDIHYERRKLHSVDALVMVRASHEVKPLDVLVVAGDFSTGHMLYGDIRMLCTMFHDIPVVFVPGNHEFYTTNKAKVHQYRETLTQQCPNLKWLNRTTFTHGDVVFAGTTLWYKQAVATDAISKDWSDFKHIEGLRKWIYEENAEDRSFLGNIIGSHESAEGQTYEKHLVVVTHMAPAWACIQERWLEAAETNYFVGGCDNMLGSDYTWIHGHCHDFLDKMCGDTRVIRNPLGYEFQPLTGFDPTFVLDLPSKGTHVPEVQALQED
jgi:predicted phosphodiesterase